MRGEDSLAWAGCAPDRETPPRAWGRRLHRGPKCKHPGNTPTCVGKTQKKAANIIAKGKHPHVRGEDIKQFLAGVTAIETPPRAWGRLGLPSLADFPLRNTPTCVGKTKARRAHGDTWWKHPHVRGEDFYSILYVVGRMGNTPTCVGKTGLERQQRPSVWKHPHVRGED